jgi:hypothetical protein
MRCFNPIACWFPPWVEELLRPVLVDQRLVRCWVHLWLVAGSWAQEVVDLLAVAVAVVASEDLAV